ncbi:MAG: GFA family protein [Rhodospirillaceae bacterium]|jgi:hypothetical protein|nr:GFA family protein [Rhodospirillaceae bacterium]MBT3491219.1 GFA family protein [Rhodospirillaceae bacterium]MBT3781158.1 GFA family protein [Rhodospirillaceae bacterium]MBT3979522.1 GFA family protein [Rhodospirillaceae bacterium]MBT4169808.1 GFA family protein [Rhodospirillaceae bacterium]
MQTYQGRCHCGAVRFEVDTVLDKAGMCNCSICIRRNAVMHRVELENLRILQGEDALQLYQFNTKTAKHYFCKTCGIYPFHRPRVAPDMVTVNIFCLEGVDRNTLAEMEISEFDGQAFSTVG